MDDVLKSLTVSDSSGKVVGLRYDSSEPLAQKLSDFPFAVGGAQSLSAFLDELKGARVELKYGPDTLSGIIVSARTMAGQEKTPEREQVVLMLDSGELRMLDLAAASSLRFADPKLQLALKDYLMVVAQSRSKEKRSVYIDSSDAKDREVAAIYMLPSPVWKSSYRLVFPEQGQATLEGWAIVDNTTADDWTNIRLAVVSGRPVSFISSLYEPRYVQRQTVNLDDAKAAGPVLYEGVVNGSLAPPPPPPAAMAAPKAKQYMQQRAVAGFVENMNAPVNGRGDVLSSVAVNTQAQDLGELFEYRFSTPVTIKRGESAMLPFIQQKVDARKLLVYSESYGLNPMNAAELSNSTGKVMDGGPITVFDGNSYAGEALVETLKTGDKRIISYSIDLGTRITTHFDSTRNFIREIHVRNGLLQTRSAMQETKTYAIHNVDAKAKTLIIEHPDRSGYKLINMTPRETTSTAYRFEVKLGPGATEKFPVNEERVYEESFAVSSMTPEVLLTYVQNKGLSDAGRRGLEQIANQKRQIAETEEQIGATHTEIGDLTSDQQRVRQNIESLNRVSGQQDQVQKYAHQLASQETQLAALRDRAGELKKQKAALESNLNSMIEKLDF